MESEFQESEKSLKISEDLPPPGTAEPSSDADVQRYKKLLKAAYERSETYKQICNNSVNPITVINPDSLKIEWANKRAAEYYSTSLEIMAGRPIGEIEPNFASGLLLKPGLMLKSGYTSVSMFTRQKDGSSKHIEVMFTILIVNLRNYLCLEYNDVGRWEKTLKKIEGDANVDARQLKIQLMEEQAKLLDKEKRIQETSANREVIENSEDHFIYQIKKNPGNVFMISYVSRFFKNTTGFDLNEVNSMGGWLELIVPADLPLYNNMLGNLDKNKSASGTYRILRKDNSIAWFKDSIMPEYEESGRAVIGYRGVVNNITRFKEIEEKLREFKTSAKSLRTTSIDRPVSAAKEIKNDFKDILLNIYKIHIDYANGIIIGVNDEFVNTFGYKREAVLRRTLTEILDSSSYNEYLKNAGRTTKSPYEIIVRSENGEKNKFSAINIPMEYGDQLIMKKI